MDIGGWLNFLAQSTVLLLACHAIVALVTGLALAPPAGVPPWAAVLICVLVPVLGPVVLLIVVAARLARRSGRTPPPAPVALADVDARAQTPSPFSGLAGGGLPVPAPASSFFGATTPAAAASPWSTAVPTPVSEPDGARPAGLRARADAVRATHQPLTAVRLVVLAVVVIAVAATASMLLVGWFTFDSQIVPPLSVSAWGTGLDVAVITSAVLLVAVLVLSWWRPSRTAAVVAATLGGIWTFVAGSVLALAAPVTELLGDIGALSYDVGDALGSFGLRGDAGVVTLPDGVDLSAVGVPGRTVDLSAIDLAAPIPAATLELGPGWFIALAVGIVVMLWSLVEVVAAGRMRRRD